MSKFAASKSAAVDTAEAISLYEHVISRRPRKILELGPGTSTAVIALAIHEVQKTDPLFRPQFIAIEEKAEWLAYHRQTIPPDLAVLVDLRLGEVITEQVDGVLAARFSAWPENNGSADSGIEFLHVDGPGHFQYGAHVTSDVIAFQGQLASKCRIVFDGREASARLAQKTLEKAQFKANRHPFTLAYTFTRH